MYSCTYRRLHVFPRFFPVTRFPTLTAGWQWLHVLSRLPPLTSVFPALIARYLLLLPGSYWLSAFSADVVIGAVILEKKKRETLHQVASRVVALSFPDTDIGPLTLASTITPLSSPGLCSPSPSAQLDGLEHDSEMDTGKYRSF